MKRRQSIASQIPESTVFPTIFSIGFHCLSVRSLTKIRDEGGEARGRERKLTISIHLEELVAPREDPTDSASNKTPI